MRPTKNAPRAVAALCAAVALAFAAPAVLTPAPARAQTPAAAAGVRSALIQTAALGTGYDGSKSAVTGAATAFKPADKVLHLGVTLKSLKAGAKVRGVLVAVDAGGVKDYKIVEQTLNSALVNNIHFTFSLPRPWPVGKYRADLYINGKKELSLPYVVKG
jgi:hypothetical protein